MERKTLWTRPKQPSLKEPALGLDLNEALLILCTSVIYSQIRQTHSIQEAHKLAKDIITEVRGKE